MTNEQYRTDDANNDFQQNEWNNTMQLSKSEPHEVEAGSARFKPTELDQFSEEFSECTDTKGQPVQTLFVLPENCVALKRGTGDDRKPMMDLQIALELIPNCQFKTDDNEYCLYLLADRDDYTKLKYVTPADVELLPPGSEIPLPFDNDNDVFHLITGAQHYIVTIETGDITYAADNLGLAWPPPPLFEPHPIVKNSPLAKHSLLGRAAELEKLSRASMPLLGEVCREGQATAWYAPPNSGKTLIGLSLLISAVREGRIFPGNAYYVNADDNGSGLADKSRILEDLGVHMVVPGFADFRANMLKDLLMDMARSGKARGSLIIIDTIKKFASLMDKRDISTFADACRQFVMHGGTILAFAHTNKNVSSTGELKYAGTTDLIEDFDAAYIIKPLDLEMSGYEKVVRFECIKRRGDSPEKIAYSYSTENGLSYEQLLSSVQEATFDKMGELERLVEERTDAEIIAAIKTCIAEDINTKMLIASTVAQRTNISAKGVIRIIERYNGDDVTRHHWTFTVRDRGKHVFELLLKSDPDAEIQD